MTDNKCIKCGISLGKLYKRGRRLRCEKCSEEVRLYRKKIYNLSRRTASTICPICDSDTEPRKTYCDKCKKLVLKLQQMSSLNYSKQTYIVASKETKRLKAMSPDELLKRVGYLQ